ncbi:unnamed protein product [Chondrus crispus]|uniref:Integrase catalytic domain-containing protein n=1 Tax=Chondrus crispus TaxID=2769 RepID=R7Q5U0_CHOCR|nr:unnamed protein product [Chondrus crispus]CDF33203.1 unnamed protein product [Chondrus crispus]|eukprot:XP_005713006.1 unnamed protein product [Chondrus crispus]
MTGTRPIAQNPYRAGPHAREAEMKKVDRMLPAGVIEPSKTAWASPVVLLEKCSFFTQEVHYLGHVIRPGTLSIDEVSTRALREIAIPTTQTELRSFLGLCNVYRRFVPNYAHKAAPLNQLLKKGQPAKLEPFDETEIKAFDTLREAVISPPILALPKAGFPYSMDTDASDYQVGTALFQSHEDGQRKHIGFWSRLLHAAERNYSTSEKECLAVVWGVVTLRPYLQGTRFTVHTEHSSLRWLMEITDPSGRLMRWRLRLGEFDFDVKYKKGKLNTQADALSRLFTSGETTVPVDEEIPCFLGRFSEMEPVDKFSDDFEDLESARFDAILTRERYSTDENLLDPITREEMLRGGVLVRNVNATPQVVAPQDFQARILYMGHHALLAGHPRGRKMFYTLTRDCYWPSLAVDCYVTARNCIHCAKERVKLRRKTKRLKLFPATAPLKLLSIDLLGELIRTPRGIRWLLVITDRFSRLVRTVPLKRITAAEIAKAFVHHWVFVYGPPVTVLADNGKQFVSRLFQEICRILGIKNVFTTTYHP